MGSSSLKSRPFMAKSPAHGFREQAHIYNFSAPFIMHIFAISDRGLRLFICEAIAESFALLFLQGLRRLFRQPQGNHVRARHRSARIGLVTESISLPGT